MFINQIPPDTSLVECLKKMDEIDQKLLVITEGRKFISVISIGDIQRAIINNIDLNALASEIIRGIITVASTKDSLESIKANMMELRAECMPVIAENGDLENIIYWKDLFEERKEKLEQLGCPVVVMAGGMGTRLRPLTNVIPKPLIPVGEKTMLETIVESFTKHGCSDFYVSVNYKSDLIKYYIDANPVEGANFSFFTEPKPLGTAGSLHLLKDLIKVPFFVTNCDILVDQDYAEIYKYHKENKNELTVVAALKHISIPYGTLETGEDGILEKITEKPELTYLINSGLYILEPHLLDEIPTNEFYHITTLINKLISEKRRVGVFPVSEKSWRDIGEWKEYFKFINIGS